MEDEMLHIERKYVKVVWNMEQSMARREWKVGEHGEWSRRCREKL